MNNLISYLEYRNKVKEMNEQFSIKQVENSVYDSMLDESIISRAEKRISKKATKFVKQALAEEEEQGKKLEEMIKKSMEELSDACDRLKTNKTIDNKVASQIQNIIEDINNVAFDMHSLLNNTDIEMGSFVTSAALAATINFGILLLPIRNVALLRRGYHYYIGLIRQAIRRDLLLLQLNFDQFENLILQKSMESEESAKERARVQGINDTLNGLSVYIAQEFSKKKRFSKEIQGAIDKFSKLDRTTSTKKQGSSNPSYDLFSQNSMDNTYKQTAEQLKNYMNDDTQKQLDSIKNSMQKIAGQAPDIQSYVELLIAGAEEAALKTTASIHTNFLKMSEVFKLSNQKKLIELIADSEKQELEEIKKLQDSEAAKKLEEETAEERKRVIKEGKKIVKDLRNNNIDTAKDLYEKLNKDELSTLMSYAVLTEKKGNKDKFVLDLDENNPTDKLIERISNDPRRKNSFVNYLDTLLDFGSCLSKTNNTKSEFNLEKLFEEQELHNSEDGQKFVEELKFIKDNIGHIIDHNISGLPCKSRKITKQIGKCIEQDSNNNNTYKMFSENLGADYSDIKQYFEVIKDFVRNDYMNPEESHNEKEEKEGQ